MVGRVRVNPPVALVVESEAIGTFSPLSLWLFLIWIRALRSPSSHNGKYHQQREPESNIEQDGQNT